MADSPKYVIPNRRERENGGSNNGSGAQRSYETPSYPRHNSYKKNYNHGSYDDQNGGRRYDKWNSDNNGYHSPKSDNYHNRPEKWNNNGRNDWGNNNRRDNRDNRGGWGPRDSETPQVEKRGDLFNYMEDGLLPRNSRLEENLFGDKDKKKEESDLTDLNFEAYEDKDVTVRGDNFPDPVDTFEQCNLGAVIQNNISLMKYVNPTPVQRYSIPILMEGRDIMSCAQTGSGKTAAFLFPIISKLIDDRVSNKDKESNLKKNSLVFPFALILAPTRELASQIFKDARRFTYRSHLRCVVIYGGASFDKQANELTHGCNVLIATPGRLIDMVERGNISLELVKYLCVDEADRMLDMGFEDQIRKIVFEFGMPDKESRQTLMFSATFPRPIQELARDFLNDYIFISIGRVGSTTELVTQRLITVEEDDKRDELIKQLNDVEGRTLIFVATRKSADTLDDFLYKHKYTAASIHGERTQYERERALDAFKTGKIRILVATDVAARGLHIDNVTHVINYDLPSNIDDYVHRIGRTGRCGKEGTATGFFNNTNMNIVKDLVKIFREANQDIPSWLLELNREKKKNYNNRNGYSRDNYRGGGGNRNFYGGGPRRGNYGGYGNNRNYNNGYSGGGDHDYHGDDNEGGGHYEKEHYEKDYNNDTRNTNNNSRFKSSYFNNQNDYQYDED